MAVLAVAVEDDDADAPVPVAAVVIAAAVIVLFLPFVCCKEVSVEVVDEGDVGDVVDSGCAPLRSSLVVGDPDNVDRLLRRG